MLVPLPVVMALQIACDEPPPARATAVVCDGCGGVHPVGPPDQDLVTLYVTVDASRELTGVRVAELELFDATGAVVARAVPAPVSWQMPSIASGAIRAFDGHIAAGAHTVLWTGAWVSARGRPVATAYRLRMTADHGVVLRVAGAMLQPGATG
jgi:hypothetical protein